MFTLTYVWPSLGILTAFNVVSASHNTLKSDLATLLNMEQESDPIKYTQPTKFRSQNNYTQKTPPPLGRRKS